MIRQASSWGQFWFDLSSIHQVHGCAIFTPLQTHIKHPAHRGRFYSTWFRMTAGGPIYHAVDGDSMTNMLIDGLQKTGCWDLRMRMNLLAVVADDLASRMEAAL